MSIQDVLHKAFGIKEKIMHNEPVTREEFLILHEHLETEYLMLMYKIDMLRKEMDALRRVKLID